MAEFHTMRVPFGNLPCFLAAGSVATACGNTLDSAAHSCFGGESPKTLAGAATVNERARRGFVRRALRNLLLAVFAGTLARSVTRAEDGKSQPTRTIRFDANLGMIVVPVTINGHEKPFILDTGATITGLDSTFQENLGRPIAVTPAETSSGEASLEVYRAPTISVAGKRAEISQVACADLRRVREILGSEVSGYLGMDFLAAQRLRIDVIRGELALLARVPEDSGVPMPLGFDALKRPTIRAVLPRCGESLFILDTGDSGTGRLSVEVAERLITSNAAEPAGECQFASLIRTRSSRQLRLTEMRLADFAHRGLIFDEGVIKNNYLGLAYLSRYVVTFDFPRQLVYLKPSSRFNEPSYHHLSGAHLLRTEGKTSVQSVDRYSAAYDADLRPRDTITDVESRPASSLTMWQIRNILSRPGRHTLRVRRGERELDVVLDLRERPDDRGM